jgi:glycosyltransferase involved in cell wall biosynthesis
LRPSSEPRVDVIIPCYNQGQYLAETLDSVLAQTYPHVQAIVIDDGSTDATPEVASRYGDRIRYLRKENAGVSAARNTGILEARGDFVHFLDSDDCLRPDLLEKHMAAAAVHPEAAVFHSSFHAVNSRGQFVEEVRIDPTPVDAFHHLLCGLHFPPCTVTVRRAALANAGLFDTSLRCSEDWDVWLRLAARGYAFVTVSDAFAVYRRHPGSVSRQFEGMWRAGLTVLKRSRAYHANCARCRAAIARGTQHMRTSCFPLLIDEVWNYRLRGETRKGVTRALRAALHTPALVPFLVRETFAYLRQRPSMRVTSGAGCQPACRDQQAG